jgi:hypothetical protein
VYLYLLVKNIKFYLKNSSKIYLFYSIYTFSIFVFFYLEKLTKYNIGFCAYMLARIKMMFESVIRIIFLKKIFIISTYQNNLKKLKKLT